jgi:hypothetical protein
MLIIATQQYIFDVFLKNKLFFKCLIYDKVHNDLQIEKQ